MAALRRLPTLACVVTALALWTGCVAPGADVAADVVPPLPDLPHRLVLPEELTPEEAAQLPAFQLVGLDRRAPEPTMGVDADGVAFVIAGTSVLRSTDGGASWQDVGPKVGDEDVPPRTLDPMLHVDAATGRVFKNTLYVGCSFLSFTDDQGGSWTHNPLGCGLPVNDHQTLATGVSTMPASSYDGRAVYYCANQFADATCAVSLDGGTTFPITRSVFVEDDPRRCGGITGHLATAPDGTVYLPAWRCDEPWIGVSTDTGETWQAFRVADKSSGAMDPAVAVDNDGNVHYFWMDEDGQPWLASSTDQGRTWREPVDARFPGYVTGSLPTIVAGDAGRIAFAYIATTEGEPVNPGEVEEETTFHLYVTMSHDALSETPSFTTVRLSPQNKPVHEGACDGGYRCGAIVDFMDVVIGPDGRVWVASANEDEGIVATMVKGDGLLAAQSG